jgi:hypothetical protein
MTTPNEAQKVTHPEEIMPPEAVAAMERRLLDAFALHHAGTVERVPSAWPRWIAAAAAIAILTGAGAAWRGLHARPPLAQPAAGVSAVSSAARSHAPELSHPVTIAEAATQPGTSAARNAVPGVTRRASRHGRISPVVTSAPFMPLPGAAGLPTFESGSIVRMDLQLSSLATLGVDISAARGRSPVQADLLVGQDGEPRAIRIVNVSSNPSSSSRSRQ